MLAESRTEIEKLKDTNSIWAEKNNDLKRENSEIKEQVKQYREELARINTANDQSATGYCQICTNDEKTGFTCTRCHMFACTRCALATELDCTYCKGSFEHEVKFQ